MSKVRIIRVVAAFLVASACTAQGPAGEPSVLRLTLRRAIEIALSAEGNTDIRIAKETVRLMEARHEQSRALRRPVFESYLSEQNLARNLGAMGVQIEIEELPDFMLPRRVGPFGVFDARLAASYNLVDRSAARHVQAAQAEVAVTEAESDNREDQVAIEVARLYIGALRTKARINTAKANVELAQALLGSAERKRAAGKGIAIEITRAQSQLVHEEYELAAAQTDNELAQLRLLNAMGQSLDTPLELTDSLAVTPVNSQSLDQAIEAAQRNRDDLEAQTRRIERARLDDRAIHAERLPTLALFADFGAVNTNADKPVATHTVGVSLSFPIFDGGRRASRRAEARSRIRREELRRKKLQDQMELEIRESIRRLELSDRQVDVAEQGLALAEEELARAKRRYEADVTNSLEVVDAQTRLRRAQHNHIEALYEYNRSRLDFLQAKGDTSSLMK